MDIKKIARKSAEYKVRLASVKERIARSGWQWYAYDSFGNLFHLDKMLTGARRELLDLVGKETLLDIGCGDGDLSFFFESLGCNVRAIDYPPTNYNGMQGVRALKEALNSQVQVHSIDIDTQFALPADRYGMVLLLGVLYHLKNPFYVLETIARRSRYCLLSTRVAGNTPDGALSYNDRPMAYLVSKDEANDDCTNFWVFSEGGLKRLVERANWEILDYYSVGNKENSDPVSWGGDARAFCLLESKVYFRLTSARLLAGWHEPEGEEWRWTEKQFSVSFTGTAASEKPVLDFQFCLPEVLLKRLGAMTLSAKVNGIPLAPETFDTEGRHAYLRPIPPEAIQGAETQIQFELDKAIARGEVDERELGLMALSVDLRSTD